MPPRPSVGAFQPASIHHLVVFILLHTSSSSISLWCFSLVSPLATRSSFLSLNIAQQMPDYALFPDPESFCVPEAFANKAHTSHPLKPYLLPQLPVASAPQRIGLATSMAEDNKRGVFRNIMPIRIEAYAVFSLYHCQRPTGSQIHSWWSHLGCFSSFVRQLS